MNNPGAVSVWLGNCKSENILRDYVDIKFDNNGNRIPSKFMNDFSLDFINYNQDLLEWTFVETATSSLSKLLNNASYSDAIISELIDFYGDELSDEYNVAIRLYDFEYEEAVEEAMLDGKKLSFIGSVMYEE
ncbi:immunity 22 family protein [Gorillibacterium sp. CAU 1737]|uniref:immunity 22 family protein n=1 Tax=Gorillibacterium sp. CAU 1737 TaxID=3140362 RepID=UPI003261D503